MCLPVNRSKTPDHRCHWATNVKTLSGNSTCSYMLFRYARRVFTLKRSAADPRNLGPDQRLALGRLPDGHVCDLDPVRRRQHDHLVADAQACWASIAASTS